MVRQKEYNWKRNTKRFQYINLKGTISHYVPDFWVNELNSYIEVKGYETELDRCKWSQFKDPLVVWKRTNGDEVNIVTWMSGLNQHPAKVPFVVIRAVGSNPTVTASKQEIYSPPSYIKGKI